MERPRIPESNRIRAQQRRASRDVTRGIEREIEELHRLDARERAKELSFFAALYALGAAIALRGEGIFVLLSILLMGVALNSLPIFVHEGLHGLLARNERINHVLTFLAGLPILVSATAYQATHNNHHYELGRALDYGTYRQHMNAPRLVWLAYFAQLVMGSVMYMIFIPILGFRAASRRSRTMIVAEYAMILTAAGVVIAVVPARHLLLFWLYPMLVLNVLTNVRGLASHALGDVENIYLSSRTVACSPLTSRLFLRENYHLEHHLFPTMPSYHLPRAHQLIWDRLPEALYSASYLDFLRTFFRAAFRYVLKGEAPEEALRSRAGDRDPVRAGGGCDAGVEGRDAARPAFGGSR